MAVTPPIVAQISVKELEQVLKNISIEVQLVDVREPMEIEICSLPGFKMFPLSEFPRWSATINTSLDPNKETLVLCHHGVRSAQMCQWLLTQGFIQVKNIVGGIEAYSSMVDPSVPRY